jgi:hypothetical protein
LTKHLMSAEVLDLARELVRKVVARLVEALATQVRSTFAGTRQRRRSSHRAMRNFDPARHHPRPTSATGCRRAASW